MKIRIFKTNKKRIYILYKYATLCFHILREKTEDNRRFGLQRAYRHNTDTLILRQDLFQEQVQTLKEIKAIIIEIYLSNYEINKIKYTSN